MDTPRTKPPLLLIAALGACLGMFGACRGGEDEENELCITNACPENFLFMCGTDSDGLPKVDCFDNIDEAQLWCLTAAYTQGTEAKLISCNDDLAGGETGDTSDTSDTGETGEGSPPWDPANHVYYDDRSQTYEVDAAFIEDLLANNLVPLGNDSARLELTMTGYYKFVDVARGDLAQILGFASSDLLISVNNYDLGTVEGQFVAYQALRNETSLHVTVVRDHEKLQLHYELVE